MATATTSDVLYNNYMQYILMEKPWTPTKKVAIALFNTPPGANGVGGQEVPSNADTNYKRVELSTEAATTAWQGPTGTNLEYSNKVEITFPVPGITSWNTINGCGIYTVVTSGDTAGSELMWVGRIATPKPVQSGDGAPRILVGQLKITRASCGT